MGTAAQRSFAGGEISPSLYARVDVVKYATGLRTCRNCTIKRSGGADSRAGTRYVTEVKDSSKTVRLIPFIFNASQTYILEFGDYYMRVIRDGVQVEVSGVAAYNGGTTYAIGDLVESGGVNYYCVAATTGNAPPNATYWYALTGDIYEIPTPYAEADLPTLNTIQSADVIVITHQNYPVYELRRTGHTSWTLPEVTFAPTLDAPTNLAVSGSSGDADEWVITAIRSETWEESLPTSSVGSSTVASTGSPRTLSWDPVAEAGEYNVYKNLNGVYGFIGVAVGTEFEDTGIPPDTTDTPPQARNPFATTPVEDMDINAGGSGYVVGDILTIVQSGASGATFEVTSVSGGAVTQFILLTGGSDYSVASGLSTSGGTGTGCTVDITTVTTNNYPGTAGYYQQRLGFANTLAEPEKVWFSKTGFFRNLTTSAPLQDDDAITFNLAGRRVNEVRQLVDLGQLIALTADAEWLIQGDTAGILRPGEINPKTQSYNGSATLKPIMVNDNAIFVQARGTVVRDLFATIEATGNIGYKGTDLTVFADHLFRLYSIVDWDYAQIPNSIVWAVRSDGTLLGLTYLREHQIWAWHRHDTDGTFENVAVIPEGSEDIPYFVVNRTINGSTKRYIERSATRKIDDIVDFIGMDSALSYDGWHTGSTTMTLTGSGWTYQDTLTLTASASTFVVGDVGNQIHLVGSDGTLIRATITAYTSGTVVSVKPNKTVPASMQGVAITEWGKAVDEISGLDHLEGKTLSIFGDGFVVGSPNNASYQTYIVSGGSVTLDKPYVVIHAGLPYLPDLETLDIDSATGETMADKYKNISNVTMFVEQTRGVWVGSSPPTDDSTDPLEGLEEYKARDKENYDDPVFLAGDQIEIKNRPEWNANGRVFVRQVDPLPLSVLAIMPAGMIPFSRGA